MGFSVLLTSESCEVWETQTGRDRADIWFELKHSQLSDLFEASVCVTALLQWDEIDQQKEVTQHPEGNFIALL